MLMKKLFSVFLFAAFALHTLFSQQAPRHWEKEIIVRLAANANVDDFRQRLSKRAGSGQAFSIKKCLSEKRKIYLVEEIGRAHV